MRIKIQAKTKYSLTDSESTSAITDTLLGTSEASTIVESSFWARSTFVFDGKPLDKQSMVHFWINKNYLLLFNKIVRSL